MDIFCYCLINYHQILLQGCKEDITPFLLPQPRWSAFRSTDYGYTRMQVFNDTHMHLEQVSDDKVCTVNNEDLIFLMIVLKMF